MSDLLEFEEEKKTVKSINLDDFSVEDLLDYLNDLKKEIKRTEDELKKKNNFQKEAEKYFK